MLTDLERYEGAVLGAAIGDAMGHPTEFVGSFGEIRRRWPRNGVTGFELWWERDGRRFAPYTDDTQMAEVVLRTLLDGRDEGLGLEATMERMAAGFVAWMDAPQGGHRAPGNACMRGSRALAAGVHWREAGGPADGGCGSVMRAYPFGLVFAHDRAEAEHWAVEHSYLTHGDPIALAACAGMAMGVAGALAGDEPETIAAAVVEAAGRHSSPTGRMIEQAASEALGGVEPEVTLERLQGWAAHEAIAAGVYVFLRHPDGPRAGILEAANSPGDSDSIATLAGALTGARCGVGALPADWVRDVERSAELRALALRITAE
jgi:ADP-ribosylglycohydrolase